MKQSSTLACPALLIALAGCCTHDGSTLERVPPAKLTLAEVVSLVNANNVPISFGLKGKSAGVSVKWTEDEGDRHLQADATVLVLKPSHMFITLDHGFGTTVMEIGCNEQRYWLWIKQEKDTLWWGKNEHLSKPCSDEMPFRPDQLFEALGVSDLPIDTTGPAGPMPRVSPTRNQLLFVTVAEDGQSYIEKEYWVDRWPPYFIRKVIHRDHEGRVMMHTSLDKYRPVRGDFPTGEAPQMAHKIHVEWPIRKATMDLEISHWSRNDRIDVNAIAFEFPGDDFDEVVQVDTECEP